MIFAYDMHFLDDLILVTISKYQRYFIFIELVQGCALSNGPCAHPYICPCHEVVHCARSCTYQLLNTQAIQPGPYSPNAQAIPAQVMQSNNQAKVHTKLYQPCSKPPLTPTQFWPMLAHAINLAPTCNLHNLDHVHDNTRVSHGHDQHHAAHTGQLHIHAVGHPRPCSDQPTSWFILCNLANINFHQAILVISFLQCYV